MEIRGLRVLVIGPAQPGDMAWFIANALKRLGADVTVFDSRRLVRWGAKGDVGRIVERLAIGPRTTKWAISKILQRAAATVDLVLTVKGDHLLYEDVAQIAMRIPIVNWYSDHPVLDQVHDMAGAYTLFCPKDTWSVERLRESGLTNVMLLPHCSDPELLGPRGKVRPEYDVSVVGTLYPYRHRWVRRAMEHDLSVAVWGGRVGAHRSAAQSGVALWGPTAFGEPYGRALRSGRLVLNTQHPNDIVGGNQRLYDAAAAGVAQITEMREDSLSAFEPQSEMLVFRSAEEFDDRVRLARSDPWLLRDISARAYQRVRDEHTYEHRLRSIAQAL